MTHGEIAAPWRALVKRVVAEYRSALGDDLRAVACFGSVARGEAGRKSDLDLYVVTRTPVSVLLDPRLQRLGGIRETPEHRKLAGAGYRPDPMPVFHTVEKLRTHPWILLDIAHGSLRRSSRPFGDVCASSAPNASSGRIVAGTGT